MRIGVLVLALALLPAASGEMELRSAPDTMARGTSAQFVVAVPVPDGPNATVLLSATLPTGSNWDVRLEPETLHVPGGGTGVAHVHITAPNQPVPRELALVLEAITVQNSVVVRENATVTVLASGGGLVLDRFANPLPPPLDGDWGHFLLEVLAWVIIAGGVHFLVIPAVRMATKRTRITWDDAIPKILGKPMFFAIVGAGVKESLEVFQLPVWLASALDRVYQAFVILLVLIVLYRVWHQVILAYTRRVAKRTSSQLDDRLLPVLEKFGGVIIIILGGSAILQVFGVNLTVLAAGGAVASLVLAFAAQDTLSNFFSGIHILVDQPFREGDDIQLTSGEICRVHRIGLRSTHLYHGKNNELIVVPNNQLASNRIVNLVRPDIRARVQVNVQVAYGTDLLRAKEALLAAAQANDKVSKDPDVRPLVRLNNFADSGLDLALWFWVADVRDQWQIASDVRESVLANFDKAGIEIPFPHRVILQGKA